MSGDVTAASERTRIRQATRVDARTDGSPTADAVTLLAEVERLRGEVAASERRNDAILAESDEVADDQQATIDVLRRENARLRAEREALHSAEARERAVAALVGGNVGTLRESASLTDQDARMLVNAVLSVLTADPEADK